MLLLSLKSKRADRDRIVMAMGLVKIVKGDDKNIKSTQSNEKSICVVGSAIFFYNIKVGGWK